MTRAIPPTSALPACLSRIGIAVATIVDFVRTPRVAAASLNLGAMLAMLMFCDVTLAATDIVIGQSLPVVVDPDGRANQIVAGTTAYVEAINGHGGIGGHMLKLITLDDDNDPKRHAANVRELVRNDHAVAILNCLGDSICKVSANVAAELHVPLIGVLAGTVALNHQSNPYVYRVRVGYDKEATALARQLRGLGVTRVALVSDSPADSEQLTNLHAAASKLGIEAVNVSIAQASAAGVNAALILLAKTHFDGAILDLRSDTMNVILEKGLDKREEWPIMIISPATGTLPMLLGNFRRNMVGFSSVVPNPERPTLPLTRELQEAAENSGGSFTTSFSGLEAYISAKICGEALRRALVRPDGRPDSERLVAALDAMNNLDLGGYHVSFAKDRTSGADFIDIAVRPRATAQ